MTSITERTDPTDQLPPREVSPGGAPPTGLRALIRRRPLTSFFVLANLLSWLAWIPFILSNSGLGLWDYDFPGGQLLGVLPGAYLGPIFSAFLVTAVADGRAGLRRWVGRLFRWRVSWKWYAISLLSVPAVMLVTGFIATGGDWRAPSLILLATYVPVLILQMLTTGLAEEPGWRDFALPRLQRRIGPWRSALLLGPMWALWHAPLFFTEWGGYPDAHWSRPVSFFVFCVAFNIAMAYVFNRTGQSLPMAMLLHVSVNTFASVLWSDIFPSLDMDTTLMWQAVAAVAVAVVIVVLTRGRLGYEPEAPGTTVADVRVAAEVR